MIAIKSSLKNLLETCDDCQWHECYPHQYKGWTDVCRLMGHSIDDDQPEEWIYDGGSRVGSCPLIEVSDGTTAPKGESKTVKSETVYVHPVNPYRGYPSWDGEDVICSNCGHILGWCSQEEMTECPACGCGLDWGDDE